MPILKAIETRRAYRALSTKPIEKEVLLRLAEAAHLSPSSLNSQPWRMITVTDPTILASLKGTLTPGNYWAKKAPAITAFVTNPAWGLTMGGVAYTPFELGMAAMAYQVQAVAEGLFVHPIAGFNVQAAKAVLGIREEDTLQTLVILGYPGPLDGLNEKHLESEKAPRVRKNLDEVASFDRWNEKLLPKQKE
ncbi:nitroreductase family protein [Sphaerochaeta sp. PS]|uniref:nitroreductase family protein n=1 Tax=Sphaerochaeta sp. PS TaxID=3076336 RepID=UPI0028A489B8|nr:nitroreductase family protein [Sphaerochaeta sp. PS]MDT4762713.1 nitroreductase family protein [Sphaerochaeta sp. PS]